MVSQSQSYLNGYPEVPSKMNTYSNQLKNGTGLTPLRSFEDTKFLSGQLNLQSYQLQNIAREIESKDTNAITNFNSDTLKSVFIDFPYKGQIYFCNKHEKDIGFAGKVNKDNVCNLCNYPQSLKENDDQACQVITATTKRKVEQLKNVIQGGIQIEEAIGPLLQEVRNSIIKDANKNIKELRGILDSQEKLLELKVDTKINAIKHVINSLSEGNRSLTETIQNKNEHPRIANSGEESVLNPSIPKVIQPNFMEEYPIFKFSLTLHQQRINRELSDTLTLKLVVSSLKDETISVYVCYYSYLWPRFCTYGHP